jgi:hypothetical protein
VIQMSDTQKVGGFTIMLNKLTYVKTFSTGASVNRKSKLVRAGCVGVMTLAFLVVEYRPAKSISVKPWQLRNSCPNGQLFQARLKYKVR